MPQYSSLELLESLFFVLAIQCRARLCIYVRTKFSACTRRQGDADVIGVRDVL